MGAQQKRNNLLIIFKENRLSFIFISMQCVKIQRDGNFSADECNFTGLHTQVVVWSSSLLLKHELIFITVFIIFNYFCQGQIYCVISPPRRSTTFYIPYTVPIFHQTDSLKKVPNIYKTGFIEAIWSYLFNKCIFYRGNNRCCYFSLSIFLGCLCWGFWKSPQYFWGNMY